MISLIIAAFLLQQTTKPQVHVFYVQDCGHCMDILLEHIPALQKKYTFILKQYDIDILENLRLLEKWEEHIAQVGEDLPVVFVGDSVFYGEEETRGKLGPTLKALTAARIPVKNNSATVLDTALVDTLEYAAVIHLYYFFQPGCQGCDRTDVVLEHLKKTTSTLLYHRYDILDDSSKVFFEALSQHLGIPDEKRLVVPAVIIGQDVVLKEDITYAALDSLIRKYARGSVEYETLDLKAAEQHIIERFSRFSIFGIILAGLLDGINPCAFATLIFFVSYLVFIGKRRRDIIIMSVFFILAVFLAYFAIGLGAYSILRYLAGYEIISKVIFFCFGIFALVLGILSLRDYMYARRGERDKMLLQLPLGIKQRIHRGIKDKTTVGGIVLGSLAAGFLISYLEFGCTGQVYLPTITFMISRAGISLKPVISLVIYNLMFILPLVIIAFFATMFTSKHIAQRLETKIPVIKLCTAILFFALAVLLFLSV
jgi:cytochrome c biogenesis protein CcdA